MAGIVGKIDWGCCSDCVWGRQEKGGCVREAEIPFLIHAYADTETVECVGYQKKESNKPI